MSRKLRCVVVVAILLVASGPLTALKLGGKKAEDATERYWQITQAVADGVLPKPHLFWRTQTKGEVIEVYDACGKDSKLNATATKVGDLEWQIKTAAAKNAKAKIDKETQKLRLTIDPNDTLFGIGQRILKPQCDKDGIPKNPVPVKVEGEQSFAVYPADSGMGHLMAAPATLPTEMTTGALPAPSQTSEPYGGGSKVCTTAPVIQKELRPLENMPILVVNPSLYVGALLQGKQFAKGNFDPITVARSGAKITLTGGVIGEDVAKSVTIGQVAQSIVNVLAKPASGAVSAPVISVFPVGSDDEALFKLGADKRFANEDFRKAIRIDPTPGKTNVLVRFAQIYYHATMENQTLAAAFKDGEKFEDRRDQIGPDNVPLLVSDIAYGRQIFLLASSANYSPAIVADTLNAAFGTANATDTCQSCPRGTIKDRNGNAQERWVPSYGQIMAGLELSYYVSGGKAVETIGPIGAAKSSEEMFNVLKRLANDKALSTVSPTNPGVPIAYSVKYLATGEIASFNYGSAAMQTTCVINPPKFHTYVLGVSEIDDGAEVNIWRDFPGMQPQKIWSGGGGGTSLNLDQWIPVQTEQSGIYIVQVKLHNKWFGSNVTITLQDYFDGGVTMVLPNAQPQRRSCRDWNTGWCVDYRIRIDRSNGKIDVVQDSNS